MRKKSNTNLKYIYIHVCVYRGKEKEIRLRINNLFVVHMFYSIFLKMRRKIV